MSGWVAFCAGFGSCLGVAALAIAVVEVRRLVRSRVEYLVPMWTDYGDEGWAKISKGIPMSIAVPPPLIGPLLRHRERALYRTGRYRPVTKL